MPKRPISAEDLLRIVFVGDPQISPSGDRVLFVQKRVDAAKNRYLSNLWTVDLLGQLVQWTQGETNPSGGRWSPDSTAIAFVAKRDGSKPQIYLLPTTGGEARRLTDLPEGSFGELRWSPDGRYLAFTFREEIEARKQEHAEERTKKGLSPEPLVTESFWYRLDGDGYFGETRFALYVVRVEDGTFMPIGGTDRVGTPQPYRGASDGTYHYDWSPDSRELAVMHTANARPLLDAPNDQIWRITLDGQGWKLDGLPKGEKMSLRWSPDGRWLAWAGDTDEDDPWGVRNTKIYCAPAEGGEVRDLTGGQDFDMSVATLSDTKEAGFGAVLEWTPDSEALYVQVGTRGEVQLGRVSRHGGVELLTEGHHHVGVGNVSRDGLRVAATVGNATRLPEVAIVEAELGTGRLVPRFLTNLNESFHEEIRLSEPEEFEVESTDGVKVHGWVMKPIDFLPPRRYPAVLEIHGGPHTQYGWAFFHEFQLLAAQGYVVVYGNPRGSKGYGQDFCAAIRGDWGNKDWDDIQALTAWMKEQSFVHPGQMAVMGGSYGGYMTNWTIGHTDDFCCAITDRCVSNMVSMAGNSDFPFNRDGYFKGVSFGDLEDIRDLWRQSPIAYFKNVKTPTLVIHSEGDLRCNIEQSEQVFYALQEQGVESRFVRYPANTSHGMSRSGPPDMRLHRLGEITTWLARFLKG
jgi:dipeptidyl aminopeptidase/acylaminoacyl peptidase